MLHGGERIREPRPCHHRVGRRASRGRRAGRRRGRREPRPVRGGTHPRRRQLHWRDDLQDPVERDIIDRATFESSSASAGSSNDTTVVLYGDKNNWFAAYAYWYLKVYGHGDVRILDGGRQKWIDEGRELTTDAPSPAASPTRRRARRIDPRLSRPGPGAARRGGPSPSSTSARPREYAGELIAPPGYEQEGAQRAGPHPDGGVDPVGERGPRRRHVQARRRAAGALREQGRHGRPAVTAYCRIGERSRPHVVRPARAPRLRGRAQLRRLVDRVGQPRRRPDREGRLAAIQPPVYPRLSSSRGCAVLKEFRDFSFAATCSRSRLGWCWRSRSRWW